MRPLDNVDAIAESIRRSHCSHEERDVPGHQCCGSYTVTPTGIKLSCPLCGDDERSPRFSGGVRKRASEILGAAGLSWEALSPDAQERVARVVLRSRCPGCGTEMPANDGRYYNCACGEYSWHETFSGASWYKTPGAEAP